MGSSRTIFMERPYSLIRVGYGWKGAFLFGGESKFPGKLVSSVRRGSRWRRIIRRWREMGEWREKKKIESEEYYARPLTRPGEWTVFRFWSNWATFLDEKLDWNDELPDFYLFVTLFSISFSSRIENFCPINCLISRRYGECRVIKQLYYCIFLFCLNILNY